MRLIKNNLYWFANQTKGKDLAFQKNIIQKHRASLSQEKAESTWLRYQQYFYLPITHIFRFDICHKYEWYLRQIRMIFTAKTKCWWHIRHNPRHGRARIMNTLHECSSYKEQNMPQKKGYVVMAYPFFYWSYYLRVSDRPQPEPCLLRCPRTSWSSWWSGQRGP